MVFSCIHHFLKAVAGRPKTERHKGVGDKKKSKGQHHCPICKDYGHHWQTCKKGSKEDIEAMKLVRGPPKKKKNTTTTNEISIVPWEDEAPTASMSFPPPLSHTLESTTSTKRKRVGSYSEASKSQSLDISSTKKRNQESSNSAASKRSRSDSNQPHPLPDDPTIQGEKKRKGKRIKKVVTKKVTKTKQLQLHSPAMNTRSKVVEPASPAMSTRSKHRLSL